MTNAQLAFETFTKYIFVFIFLFIFFITMILIMRLSGPIRIQQQNPNAKGTPPKLPKPGGSGGSNKVDLK